jgi:hypothetical protein
LSLLFLASYKLEKAKSVDHVYRLLKDIPSFASMRTTPKLELANRIKEAMSKTLLSTRKIAAQHILATCPWL